MERIYFTDNIKYHAPECRPKEPMISKVLTFSELHKAGWVSGGCILKKRAT